MLNPFKQKTTLAFALLIVLVSNVNAQWTSPGNGTTYNIDDLIEVSEGCVVWNESNLPCTLATMSP